jgi:hypothetical protein
MALRATAVNSWRAHRRLSADDRRQVSFALRGLGGLSEC